jgi:adenine deaminase
MMMSSDSFWLQDARRLVDTAMGRSPADLVILDGQWVCVQSGEVVAHTDIAVRDGRVAYVGADARHTIGAQTQVLEAKGRFLVPGLLDGHVHIESGLLTVTEFVRAVVPHGTTGLFIDPHEIANVFGLRGVRLMVDEAGQQPIHVYVQMPSCVPSAPGFETPGSSLGPADVAEAMTWPGIIGLGEMMNFPGVCNGDDKVHAEMAVARQSGKVIGGHYAVPDLGLPFHGYVAGGPQDDHEGTRREDAVARARQGLRVMMRYGSAWQDVVEQSKAITENRLDPRHFILCTDDAHCETLVKEGHMDRIIRHAIRIGLDPMMVIQMATLNTAEYFGVSGDVGMIAPRRHADLLLVKDLTDFSPDVVIAGGRVIAEEGVLRTQLPDMKYPAWVLESVHLLDPLRITDFRIPAPHKEEVMAHVIGIIENQAPTRHLRMKIPVVNGEVRIANGDDLAKVAVIERQRSSGRIQLGLVHGFSFNVPCAVATTMAHDCHHLVVVGTDELDMALAANVLAECGGGQVVVRKGEVIGMVELPIAGIISNEPAHVVAQKAATVLEGFRACGCSLNNPNMQLSLLALVVIPSLRISDLGLVDVDRFDFIALLE